MLIACACVPAAHVDVAHGRGSLSHIRSPSSPAQHNVYDSNAANSTNASNASNATNDSSAALEPPPSLSRPPSPCAARGHCTECTRDPRCGWCSLRSKCMPMEIDKEGRALTPEECSRGDKETGPDAFHVANCPGTYTRAAERTPDDYTRAAEFLLTPPGRLPLSSSRTRFIQNMIA